MGGRGGSDSPAAGGKSSLSQKDRAAIAWVLGGAAAAVAIGVFGPRLVKALRAEGEFYQGLSRAQVHAVALGRLPGASGKLLPPARVGDGGELLLSGGGVILPGGSGGGGAAIAIVPKPRAPKPRPGVDPKRQLAAMKGWATRRTNEILKSVGLKPVKRPRLNPLADPKRSAAAIKGWQNRAMQKLAKQMPWVTEQSDGSVLHKAADGAVTQYKSLRDLARVIAAKKAGAKSVRVEVIEAGKKVIKIKKL